VVPDTNAVVVLEVSYQSIVAPVVGVVAVMVTVPGPQRETLLGVFTVGSARMYTALVVAADSQVVPDEVYLATTDAVWVVLPFSLVVVKVYVLHG
jgi:hypothetical protein